MDTLAQLHLASQYLATAGKSFLKERSDDSHTNLGFFPEDNTLRTWPLNDKNAYLSLRYDDFSLEWIEITKRKRIYINGKSHKEITAWVATTAEEFDFSKSYQYHLHYELPYEIDDNSVFNCKSNKELEKLAKLTELAQNAMDTFLKKEGLTSTIRVWPHHFDIGAFAELTDNSGKSIGLGMAIPDSVMDKHYFYISGYKGHDSLETDKFSELSHGEWKNNGFKGAVLDAVATDEKTATNFFQEAFACFKT
ncbi:hypothetical protein ACFSQJ_11875 [Croceitalea marina]|uniref:Uncharacterized protein n=1 Tax=Croceitalea marina TaxID=1775166 RepID=A0ABW5N0U7_9FLAO